MKTFKLQAVGLGLIASIAVVLMCMLCPAKAMAEEAVAYSVSDDGQEVYYYTFQSAIEAGYGGNTVIMTSDWNANEQIKINDNKAVTIDMKGHMISVSQEHYYGIYVGENASLTLMSSESQYHIYEGYSSDSGQLENYVVLAGGLVTDGSGHENIWSLFYVNKQATLTLDSIVAGGSCGGCVTLQQGSTLFMNNDARIQHNRSTAGGGISVYGENVGIYMDNSSINNNYVTDEGGAICAHNYDGTKIGIDNHSQIASNTAGRGGAIYIKGTYCSVISNDRTGRISGNVARYCYGGCSDNDGGAITIDSPKAAVFIDEDGLIEGLTIDGNSANDSDEGFGGGIYIEQEDVRIVDCVITGNSAGKEGGGVYVDRTVDVALSGRVIISQNKRGSSADDLFLADDFFYSAYITGGVSAGSYVGIRTGMSDDQMVGENITTYTPGTYFMDLGGYYITKGTDHGGDLWQRHGDHKFAVMLQGKSIGDYYPGETVTVDGSTGNAYLVFSQWLEDESSGLFPFVDYVEDKANSTLTFTMPQNDVNLWHSLKILPPDKPAPRPAPSPTV